ncbi:MAG: biopolymer transporter ExbD [Puniceicoccales bacterium]|jgi:biopolymer transport protein ExbD/biopolymer transport protein TolR|nr:biopolymer transporter ExbD [Puniceicoccales bacterium]
MSQRNFSRPRRMHALSELNVTPLLDLCFCLLIIFMIATPVLEQTTQIDLPIASKAIATTPPATPIPPKILALDRNGQLIYDGRVTHEDALRAELKKLAAIPLDQQPIIRIRADGNLRHQRFYDLCSLLAESGLSKVNLDTQVKD